MVIFRKAVYIVLYCHVQVYLMHIIFYCTKKQKMCAKLWFLFSTVNTT